jgi:hypothetical protein
MIKAFIMPSLFGVGPATGELAFERQSIGEPVPQQRHYRLDAVAPVDFLTLFLAPRIVRNRLLDYFYAAFQHFGSDLRAEFEALTAKRDTAKQLGREDFVAGRFVGKFGAIENI